MKNFENGVSGPDLAESDIVAFDLGDAEVQFCLPKDPAYPNGLTISHESLKNWKSASDIIHIAKTRWLYNAQDEEGEWNAGIVTMEMELFNLDMIELEPWLEAEPYCLLKQEELSRLATDYFIRLVKYTTEDLDPPMSLEDALQRFGTISTPKDLIISKQDLLPWFTNKQKEMESGSSWISKTFIPVSDRAVILLRFDFDRLTVSGKPFFFSETEGQAFGDMLREEFLSYVKITYSPEIQAKIKSYAQEH